MGRSLQELNKLEQYLKARGIKYEREDRFSMTTYELDWHQISVPCSGPEKEWDAIPHRGSYGYEDGLLEIMGSIVIDDTDDLVEGWLTADDVIRRIEAKMDGETNETD